MKSGNEPAAPYPLAVKSVIKLAIEPEREEEMSEHRGYDSTPWRAATGASPAAASVPRLC